MSTRTPTLRIVCSTCPLQGNRPVTIGVSGGDETVRCPHCASYYRVQTLSVSGQPQEQVLGGNLSDYHLSTRNDMGAPATHRFTGPMGMHLADGETVSLVWQGRHLIGVANQAAQTWYPITRVDSIAEPLRLNGWLGGAVALVVALSMLAVYHTQIGDALLAGGPASVVILILAAAVVSGPWVADTLARRGGE